MPDNKAVPHEEWLKARLELLAAEKEFTRPLFGPTISMVSRPISIIAM